jgi:hypothetical protein
VFVVGASNLFTSLQDALNSIWGVEKTKGGWLQVVRDRAVSGGMIVVIGLILIMTFIGNGAVAFLTLVRKRFAFTLRRQDYPAEIPCGVGKVSIRKCRRKVLPASKPTPPLTRSITPNHVGQANA